MRRGSWHEIRRAGVGQFVWRFGVICFGGLFFVTNTLVRWLSNDPGQRYNFSIVGTMVIVSFVYSLSIGTACGFVGWGIISLYLRFHGEEEQRSHQLSAAPEKSRAAEANK